MVKNRRCTDCTDSDIQRLQMLGQSRIICSKDSSSALQKEQEESEFFSLFLLSFFSSLPTVPIASRTVVGRVLFPDLGRRSQNARSEFREKVLYVFAVQSSSTLNLGTKISMQ
ncbi:hypothetical protein GQ457_03G027050 [Hibiscus cannabinus]